MPKPEPGRKYLKKRALWLGSDDWRIPFNRQELPNRQNIHLFPRGQRDRFIIFKGVTVTLWLVKVLSRSQEAENVEDGLGGFLGVRMGEVFLF